MVKSAIDILLDHEGGGFVPRDNRRGASKWGITQATYAESHPGATDADIARLTRAQAADYYSAWFRQYRLDLLAPAIALQVFDTGVNIGPVTAIKLLQQALGLAPDGKLGPATAAAANRDEAGSLRAFRMRAEQYYRRLQSTDPVRYSEHLLESWLDRLWDGQR